METTDKCKNSKSCKDVIQLNKRIAELSAENDVLKYELRELRTKYFGSSRRKKLSEDSGEEQTEPEKKKRGAPVGHPGWFRSKPKHIDEIIEVGAKECPLCGGANLTDCPGKIEDHLQEDIILPRVKTTCYRHGYKYCKDCKEVIAPPAGKDELINSYIGPVAKALSVYMKYEIKVSDRDIQELFEKLFNLRIVPASIPGFRNQLSRRGIDIYNHLLEQIRASSYVNIDETGWREDGFGRWLWNFSNDKISINHIDESRGRKVVDKILGEKYQGITISDFLASYDKVKAKAKQRCLVHLFRNIKKILKLYRDDDTVQKYCKYLKKLLHGAIELKNEYYLEKKYSFKDYMRKCEQIEQSLADFQFPDPRKGILLKLSKRLNRYKKEIFTFLYHKEIPYHNNHAEQMIRPNVLLRKIVFGNRSPKGVFNHNVLMSIIQTAKLNGREEFDLLKRVLMSEEKEKLLKYLVPP